MSYKKQELLTINKNLGSPPVFDGVRVAHLFIFFSVLCFCVLLVSCHVSCVPNVASVSVMCLVCPMLPVSLVMCLVYPMLPVSLSCVLCAQCCQCLLSCVLCAQCCQCLLSCVLFTQCCQCLLIAHSGFSNVYSDHKPNAT